MACCTFKPPFMAAANYSRKGKTKSHLIQTTRNSQALIQYQLLMIPFERVKLSTRSRRPLFSRPLKGEGIPSLPQCLFSADSVHHTYDDDDPQNKQSRKKINIIEAQEQEKDSVSFFAEPPLEDVLVKVICEYEDSDFERRKPRLCMAYFTKRTTIGLCIEGRRLLTYAHCIQHHTTRVVVEKHGSENSYEATVMSISNDFNLAMLTVSDDEFWEGLGCVELGDMPSLGDVLTSMSYLKEMDNITSTSGFVVDMVMIPCCQLPAFVVCYDSEFGEYGSAVFNENGKCVGMAFDASESIRQGRVISATIIKHFIQYYNCNGGFMGVPIFGVKWQKMQNHDLRMFMGMQHGQEGVRIIDKDLGCPGFEVLELDDVILSIDGFKVANDGTVPFGEGLRVDLNYLFALKCPGDNVLVQVLRYSEKREFHIKLATSKQFLPGVVKGRPQN